MCIRDRLMAIFKSRPSPYAILDEVDAALDEANTERFINVIKGFLDKSHFIVITRHKRTMMGCDTLYGITMQERGVSTRVSVDMKDVGADGTLAPSAGTVAEEAAAPAPVGDAEPEPEPESQSESEPSSREQLAAMLGSRDPVEVGG